MDKTTALKIYKSLDSKIRNAVTELKYSSVFELLIAVILSAQCTDKQVNKVTEKLFKLYNTPQDFARLNNSELEKLVYSTGFYKNKAKNIILASNQIINSFNGEVPDNLSDLMMLAGVGKKTANVILSAGFNKPAIAVDTHVFRVSNRTGLIKAKNVKLAEQQLEELFDKKYYTKLHNLLVLHGRYVCTAKKPKCNECVINRYCKYYKENETK